MMGNVKPEPCSKRISYSPASSMHSPVTDARGGELHAGYRLILLLYEMSYYLLVDLIDCSS